MHCLYFFGERKFYTRTQVNITREWKSTLGQHLQWVAFNYYIKSYPDRVYTPVTETPVSGVWRATTRSTRGSSFLSQKRRWNHCFCMWTGALSQGFRAGVRVIRYSHKLISAHKRVERFLTCQPRWRLYSVFMLLNSVTALWLFAEICNRTFILFTKTCAVLDKPPTSNVLRVWDKKKFSVKSACSLTSRISWQR